MDLIEFQDLPNTDTPINAENLNNNFNELNKANTRSTEEQVIGTWLGKPLYSRVFTGTLSDDGADDISGVNATNNKLINAYGYIGDNVSGTHLGNYINEAWFSGVYINDTNFQIWYGNSLNNKPFEICLEYTKRTD